MPTPENQIGPAFSLTPIDVCNNSLDQIGQQAIGSFDEGTEASEACKRYYPSNLRMMIADHNWRFARRRVYLPQFSQEQIIQILSGYGSGGFGGGGYGGAMTEVTVTAIPGPYQCWYGLPNNCVRARRINGDDCYAFTVEGRILMSNYAPVYLDYGAYIDDPNIWDGPFQSAFEFFLASKLAAKLTGNLKLAASLYAEYADRNNEAKAIDSQTGTPEVLQSNAFTSQRE